MCRSPRMPDPAQKKEVMEPFQVRALHPKAAGHSFSLGLGCSSPKGRLGFGKHNWSRQQRSFRVKHGCLSTQSYLDLKKIFTRKRQSIIFHGEANTDGAKKRALIRTVSVLFAAFHPQISKCFNMTELSLFTMWGTRGNCTLRQLAVSAHTHRHSLSLLLSFSFSLFLSFPPCGISGPPVCAKCPARSPTGTGGILGHSMCTSKRCCSL